jgi:hypothetical protein
VVDITPKAQDVLPGLQRGIVVEFTGLMDGCNYGEHHGFEPYMRAVMADCKFDKRDECWLLTFDFADFAEYNKRFETPGWSDCKGGFDLKWSESVFYPKNKRETIAIQPDHPVPFAIRVGAKEDYMLERYKRAWDVLFRYVHARSAHDSEAQQAMEESWKLLDGIV